MIINPVTMDLRRKIHIRFPSSPKEYGPYEIAKVAPSPGAMCRFEGDDNWQPLELILVAFDSQPATQTQRQRLRKHNVAFDETTITRREARELYRMIPAREAQRKQRADQTRKDQMATARQKFKIADSISDEDLATLQFASPASTGAVAKLEKLIGEVEQLGHRVKLPKYWTEEEVAEAIDALELFDYTSSLSDLGCRKRL